MFEIIFFGLLVALAGVGVLLLKPTRTERLRESQRQAQREIDAEYRKTRRRMNDMAGQSWRNIGE